MNTQAIHFADGTTSTVRSVSEHAVIRRVRRRLAPRGHQLQVTRPDTDARTDLGEYAVMEGSCPLETHCDLGELARRIGALANDEFLDPAPCKGWRHYVAKAEEDIVEGIKTVLMRPLTREYSTFDAALRAGKAIIDREGVGVISYNPLKGKRRQMA